MNAPTRILLVDGRKASLSSTRRLLEKAGYQVFAAQDGKQALELAHQHLPNLVLLDEDLPDMPGHKVCRQIKADASLAGMFVVMFSANSTGTHGRAEGLENCADGIIARHLSKGELLARVQILLRLQTAEAALHQQERDTRAQYETMTEMFVMHELVYDSFGKPVDYRILDCNPAFERFTGINASKAVGAMASQLYGTGEAPYLEHYAPVAETGIPVTFETEFAPLGKWFRISAFSLAKGRFATLTSDLTEQKRGNLEARKLLDQATQARRALLSILEDRQQAEKSLRENQARLDLALQSALMGVWRWEIAENRRYFDEQTCRLLGLDPATFGGSEKEFLRAVHPDDWETLQAAQERTVKQGVLYEPEYRARWPDGSVHYLTARGKLVRDEAGEPARIDGLVWDITESKLAELELARRVEELARLYRASSSLLMESPFDLNALAQTILKIVLDEFGQSNCSLFLVENETNKLDRIATVGPYTEQVTKTTFTLEGPGLAPLVARNGQMLNTPDVTKNPAYIPAWDMARSELTIPLKVGNRVIGVIDVQSALAGFFSTNDERLMGIFAERAALALEHARLYTQTERHLENLSALRVVDTAIASSSDIQFTLDILLNQLSKRLGNEAARILIFNPVDQTFPTVVMHGFDTGRPGHSDLRLSEEYARQAVRERRAITIEDLARKTAGIPGGEDLVRAGFTAYQGIPLIAKGVAKGVLEIYPTMPINLDEEKRTFLDMLTRQAAIAIESAQLFENLQNSNIELMMAYDETIEGWSQALDLRDKETEGHSLRVTEITVKLAAEFGCRPNELIQIRRGALLHDIGKLGVPDEILLKPGPLTDEEWKKMRKHPQLAYEMLVPITYLHPALDIPYCHHEKWDGSGYPRGLKGNQIPLAARIFAVVDVWDALTSERPYRKAWSKEKALAYIQEQVGKHFDPDVVNTFLRELLK